MFKGCIILFSFLLSSNLAQAGNGIERLVGVDFTRGADISIRAQEKLVHFLNSRCRISNFGNQAIAAKLIGLERVRVDQGIIDETYRVIIGYQPSQNPDKESQSHLAEIILTDYAGTNPSSDWVQIEKVTNLEDGFCK
jgi:hypothetical protein